MKNMICWGVLVLTAVFASACGSKGEGGEGGKGGGAVVAGCDQRGVSGMSFQTCTDYTGTNWTAKEVEAQCAGDKKFIAGTCPKDGVVVSCKMYAGKASELVTHYYDKADEAKAACERLEGSVQ